MAEVDDNLNISSDFEGFSSSEIGSDIDIDLDSSDVSSVSSVSDVSTVDLSDDEENREWSQNFTDVTVRT